ncbi:MAG: SAM-dependent methyltransferase, partial [Candidatus Poseidoniaceae archaeon]|nr:SAM-dependent methyltransferase [Candidatus Poseidoniaceae archaeon]
MAGVTEPTINAITGQYDGRELNILAEESAMKLDEGQGQADSLIPVEIRKPMAAYYTLPEAARLLAELAIHAKDDTIIDPACGSGTLLVAAYQAKKRMYGAEHDDYVHKRFLENDILGIEFMPFAARLAAKHLATHNLQYLSTKARIGITDAMAVNSDSRIPSLENEHIVVGKAQVVLMNPPFSRFQNLSSFSNAGSYVNSMKHHFGNRSKYITNNMSFNNFFLLKCEDFLEQDGRVASVLPATALVGGSNEQVRNYLSKKYFIDTVIIRSDRC